MKVVAKNDVYFTHFDPMFVVRRGGVYQAEGSKKNPITGVDEIKIDGKWLTAKHFIDEDTLQLLGGE